MKILPLPEYSNPVERFMRATNPKELGDTIKRAGSIAAIDTETYYNPDTGGVIRFIKESLNNTPFCLTVTIKQGDEYLSYFVAEEQIQDCKDWLEDENIVKVLHNSKYDMHMLLNVGIHLKGKIWDTMIMIHLIDEEHVCRTPDGNRKQSKALKDLAYHYLGDNGHLYENLVDEVRSVIAKNRDCAKSFISYRDAYEASPDIMKDYACSDTEFTYKLFEIFKKKLVEQELLIAYDTDINATHAVLDIERNGMAVDMKYYDELENELGMKIVEIDDTIREMGVPDELNINASADIVEMFSIFGFEWKWFTPKGEHATNDKTLSSIIRNNEGSEAATLAQLILDRRELTKIKNTFIAQIRAYTQPDGKIHADFNVCPREDSSGGTVTGRLSSSNPNLQNIPKDDKRVRKGLVPSEGYVFAELDYSAQEYRLLGVYANDRNFSEIIHQGKDIHAGTAELMLGISHEDAKIKKNRDIGKRINFGLVYGLGAANFAANIGFKIDAGLYNKAFIVLRGWGYKPWDTYPPIADMLRSHPDASDNDKEALEYYFSNEPKKSIADANELKDKYFAQFPMIQDFLNQCRARTKYRGYCKTWTGRRRHFKKPSEEAYKAPNAVIQGGCGDITKQKMWECYQFLLPYKSRMVNNIHDAILFEIHESEMDLLPKLKEIMVDLPFSIPFDTSVEVGRESWAKMEEIDV